MPTDTEQQIWEEALIKIGFWEYGRLNPNHISASITPQEPHDIPCPPLADPAAVVAMLEYLKPLFYRVGIGQEENGYFTLHRGNNLFGYKTLPLALVAAVLAIPVEKSN